MSEQENAFSFGTSLLSSGLDDCRTIAVEKKDILLLSSASVLDHMTDMPGWFIELSYQIPCTVFAVPSDLEITIISPSNSD